LKGLVRPLLLLTLFSASLAAEPPNAPPAGTTPPSNVRRVVVSDDFTAVLDGDSLSAEVRPVQGETPVEFARRVGKDEAAARQILALPGGLTRTRLTLIGFPSLSIEMKKAVAQALFPSDLRATTGWLHIAVVDEKLTAIATWFTTGPETTSALAKVNGISAGIVPRGTTVRIPVEYLVAPFRGADVLVDEEPADLEFGEDEKGKYAVYRLRKKEALYSAVVARFTGRLDAPDVIDLALKIAARSGIPDVHQISIGYPIKIPVEYLTAEFLPKSDPKAEEFVKGRAEASQFSVPAKATGLAGVRVVIDAGHGGRDTGTLHDGVWESTHVYDVACRLRKLLLEKTRADVVMTTKEPDGWNPPERDRLKNSKSRFLMTEPPYLLDDPVIGVNLRWYLANSVLKRPGPARKKIAPEKTVFLSIHADSLHPSVRGAMVYIPGERFLRDRYGKRGTVYAKFREFKEEPAVAFSKKERVTSEGVSTTLAEKLLAAMREEGLPVHRFSPVRTHVIRGGREWVPAVLRYNRIPNRALVEIANLGNEEDRALTVTRAFRQKMAEAIVSGLLDFFRGDEDETPAPKAPKPPKPEKARAVASSALEGPASPAYGPWPEPHGPMPDFIGPRRPGGSR